LEMAKRLQGRGFVTRGLRFGGARDLFRVLKENPGADAILLLKGRGDFRLSLGRGGHWVLLETIEKDRAVLLDPFLGRVSVPPERLRSLWRGHALLARVDDRGGG